MRDEKLVQKVKAQIDDGRFASDTEGLNSDDNLVLTENDGENLVPKKIGDENLVPSEISDENLVPNAIVDETPCRMRSATRTRAE